jgi:hypothetical protein
VTASVTVLIPSRDAPLIDLVVDAVAGQDGIERVREVLVIGRDTPGLLRERALPGGGRVRLLDTGAPVSEPVARNLGLRQATGGLVVFLDSDCVPRSGWLRAHLAAHEGAPASLVCGAVDVGRDRGWALAYNLSLFWAFLDTSAPGPRPALPTLNLSFPRELAERVGAFDERLTRATDVDWTLRARALGLALRFDPAPVVQHRHARHDLRAVWSDCAGSGFHARRVRLASGGLLAAPAVLRAPLVVRALAPLIATWASARVACVAPRTFRGRWGALPRFWLTKLAWAWGAGTPDARR